MRALPLVLLLAAAPLIADCIPNGHYTIVANPDPMIGTPFPYTEDLASSVAQQPIGARVELRYAPETPWVKVQTGCAAFAERNVSASMPVNLMLRASFRINAHTASPDTRFQVQFRLDDNVVATDTRRIGNVPRSDRFATMLPDLPAGNYVYSLWARLIDGPETNSAIVDLQWITAQGAPISFPAEREALPPHFWIDGNWQSIGHPLHFDAAQRVDLALQSTFAVEEADDDAKIDIAFTVDNARIGDDFGTLAVPQWRPDALIVFDARPNVRPGEHTLRLWLRTRGGRARVSSTRFELMGFPSRIRESDVLPMVRVEADEVVVTNPEGTLPQPAIPAGCGLYTKILEFTMPPTTGSFSWTLEGYIELLGVDVSGYGQLAIVSEYRQRKGKDEAVTAVSDMGIFDFQAVPGGDGIYFYGDSSKWGNDQLGDRMSLWIRRIEGCRGSPLGGGFTVGKRWLAIKLLPSEGPHLP